MIITLNGADGSGKSTILEAIVNSTNGEILHYHSRPGNIVSKDNVEMQKKYVNRPGEVPKRKSYLQIAKVTLFLCEFHLLAIWHKIRSRHKLVILERSLIDLYAHPERYGLEPRLVESTRALLTEWYSDLNICLTGDPQTMADRKQELEESEISEINSRYLEILGKLKDKLLVIDTTKESVAESTQKMSERLHEISRGRKAK